MAGLPRPPQSVIDKVAARVKSLRNDRGMTQDEFAAYVGFSVTSVRMWEGGRNYPSRNPVARIAAAAASPALPHKRCGHQRPVKQRCGRGEAGAGERSPTPHASRARSQVRWLRRLSQPGRQAQVGRQPLKPGRVRRGPRHDPGGSRLRAVLAQFS